MKKLIVGSVFINDSPIQQKWLDLQLKFLSETTSGFDHVVVLSDGVTNDYFEKNTKVLVSENATAKGSEAHCNGLNRLTDYFREHESQYENFLYIDSDAFPIKKNWLETLLNRMQPQDRVDINTGAILTNKKKGREYDIAAALRSENLESRLHASILFVKKKALQNIVFQFGRSGDDLAGNPELDVYIPKYQKDLRYLAFPLIRTNKNNLHPVACGVYFDMFYHHSCGSGRPFHTRASDDYMSNFIPRLIDVSAFTEKLMAEPCDFTRKLAGWSPIRYADF